MSGVETQHVLTRSRVRTVAERNGVSESTVWRLIRAGKLTAHRVGRRITLIETPKQIACLAARLKQPPSASAR